MGQIPGTIMSHRWSPEDSFTGSAEDVMLNWLLPPALSNNQEEHHAFHGILEFTDSLVCEAVLNNMAQPEGSGSIPI